MEENLSFSDIIRTVHKDLILSENMRIDTQMEPLFKVSSLTLEINFVVEKLNNKSRELNLKVVTLGSTKNINHSEINKVTLHLEALSSLEKGLGSLNKGSLPSKM